MTLQERQQKERERLKEELIDLKKERSVLIGQLKRVRGCIKDLTNARNLVSGWPEEYFKNIDEEE